MAEEERIRRYAQLGLKADLAGRIAGKEKLAVLLDGVINEAQAAGLDLSKCEKKVGALLYELATTFIKDPIFLGCRAHCARLIVEAKITVKKQIELVVKWLNQRLAELGTAAGEYSPTELEKVAGVGLVITEHDIRAEVNTILEAKSAEFKQDGWGYQNTLQRAVGGQMPLASFQDIKRVVEAELTSRLGPKPAKSAGKTKKKKAKAPPKKEEKEEEPDTEFAMGRPLAIAVNTKEALEAHAKETEGKIRTRFPPEPNGFLHLGHGKAINFNFGVAKRFGGECILRFDDTNPEAEEQRYIDSIIDCVTWLGFKPCKITYSSDWFHELHQFALRLINQGDAFVCQQTKAEIQASRESKQPSPWRDRSIQENLRLFEDMRLGKFREGEYTLRMKMDYLSDNPNMWDSVAYRIKYVEHPHVGDEWCIYPSYDYTHCIVDSLEHIDYSLCTLEFEGRRESYYWLLDKLGLYKPKVWEYSRLNLQYAVMSKRKLKALVDENYVDGWDDPRMITLMGLRRRGYTPEIINTFCDRVGVSRNTNTIRPHLLEHCARMALDPISPRVFVVQDPLKVVLTNWPEGKMEQCQAPVMPKSQTMRSMPMTGVVYIERSDFKEKDAKGYYGFAPNKQVYLKNSYAITCTDVIRDAAGQVSELRASVDLTSRETRKKVKGYLHWVSAATPGGEPLRCQVRLYDSLFTVAEPGSEDDWRATINPESLTVCHGYAEASMANAAPGDHFQFERLGYYFVDPKSSPSCMLINRTVTLKDTWEKKGK